jgi:hypothetical protein
MTLTVRMSGERIINTCEKFTEIGKRLLGVPIFMPSSIRDETVIHWYKHYFLKVDSE